MHIYNKRKQETIVKILIENECTSKNITLSLHILHRLPGLHSLQSAVCSLHGLRFNMTDQVRTRKQWGKGKNGQVWAEMG